MCGPDLCDLLVDRVSLWLASLLTKLFVDEVPHGCADDTGSVCIDIDMVFCHLHCVCLGESSDCPLRGTVVGKEGEWLECYNACALHIHTRSVLQ